jgi:hypothetical protein
MKIKSIDLEVYTVLGLRFIVVEILALKSSVPNVLGLRSIVIYRKE